MADLNLSNIVNYYSTLYNIFSEKLTDPKLYLISNLEAISYEKEDGSVGLTYKKPILEGVFEFIEKYVKGLLINEDRIVEDINFERDKYNLILNERNKFDYFVKEYNNKKVTSMNNLNKSIFFKENENIKKWRLESKSFNKYMDYLEDMILVGSVDKELNKIKNTHLIYYIKDLIDSKKVKVYMDKDKHYETLLNLQNRSIKFSNRDENHFENYKKSKKPIKKIDKKIVKARPLFDEYNLLDLTKKINEQKIELGKKELFSIELDEIRDRHNHYISYKIKGINFDNPEDNAETIHYALKKIIDEAIEDLNKKNIVVNKAKENENNMWYANV